MQNIFLVAAVIGLAAGRLGLADDTNPMPGKSPGAEFTAAPPLRSIAAH
jgi:hypothetical protein